MSESKKEFGKLRAIFWPIYGHELKKFVLMAVMFSCLIFNYTIVRNLKDTLVINAAGAGIITFLKMYCVTPSALLFVVIFMKLSSVLSKENLFYVIISFFIGFFLLFVFILYPNAELIHPSKETIEAFILAHPSMSGFADIYAYWSYSLFYIFAELWGSVVMALLFWSFANRVVKMEDSKRLFPMFLAMANISTIFCGVVAGFCANGMQKYLPEGADVWNWTLNVEIGLVCVVGCLAMFIYKYLHLTVFKNIEANSEGGAKKKKPKLSLGESFKIVFTSKHLLLIASLVICYGVSINLIEVQWKNQVKIFFEGNKPAFNAFMNQYSMWTGVISTIFGWFVATGLVRRLSWMVAALITPIIILTLGSLFYGAIFMKEIFLSMAINPVMIAAYSGAAVVLLSKIIKYSLFDATKNMAYIPLDDDLKTKGNAAVEVIGGRLGKAGGAFIQSTLLILMATKDVLSIAPVTIGFFIGICVLWFYAVRGLSNILKKCSKT